MCQLKRLLINFNDSCDLEAMEYYCWELVWKVLFSRDFLPKTAFFTACQFPNIALKWLSSSWWKSAYLIVYYINISIALHQIHVIDICCSRKWWQMKLGWFTVVCRRTMLLYTSHLAASLEQKSRPNCGDLSIVLHCFSAVNKWLPSIWSEGFCGI